MKRRRVIIDPDALDDLAELHRWISRQGAPQSATAYIRRIQAFARSLALAAERGTPLDELDPGLRVIPFESVVLAVRVRSTDVVVVRVLHAARDWRPVLGDDSG
jgi:toxin ParE1/3/4